MSAQPEDTMADPYVEGLAQLAEAQHNKAAAFALRNVGPVGTIHHDMLAKLRELFVPVDQFNESLRLHAKVIADLVDQKAEMAAALEPFAAVLEGNYSHQSDELEIQAGAHLGDLRFKLKLGDFRRARAALTKLGGEHGQG